MLSLAQLYSNQVQFVLVNHSNFPCMYFNLLQMWNWLSKSMKVHNDGRDAKWTWMLKMVLLHCIPDYCFRAFTHTHTDTHTHIYIKQVQQTFSHHTDSYTFAKMRLILNGATLRITKSDFGLFWVLLLGNRFLHSIWLAGWWYFDCALTTSDETNERGRERKKNGKGKNLAPTNSSTIIKIKSVTKIE